MNSPQEVINLWAARILADPGLADRLGGTIKIVLSEPDSTSWVLTSKGIVSGIEADCTLLLSADDLIQIAKGKLNPQAAWNKKQIKVYGDPDIALQFGEVIFHDDSLT